jgi:hypothetical protein
VSRHCSIARLMRPGKHSAKAGLESKASALVPRITG